MNAWSPGRQSTVFPNAPAGLLFPGDPGVPRRHRSDLLEGAYAARRRRLGSHRPGTMSVRAAYGIFYDCFTNGVGGPLQAPAERAPVDAGPPTAAADPLLGSLGRSSIRSPLNSFPQPTTVLTIESGMRPPYIQNWNLSFNKRWLRGFLIDVRYVGTKGTRLPRMIEANPAVYGPGATADNADQRRLYAGCHALGSAVRFRVRRSDHQLNQLHLPRRPDRAHPALLERPFVPGFVYVFEVARLRFQLQRGGLRAAPRRRRKRPRSEPLQPAAPSTVRRSSMPATASSSAAPTKFRSITPRRGLRRRSSPAGR